MKSEIIFQSYIISIVISTLLGTLARVATLIVDYRQYPSYPNGYLTHIVTGFVASALGAVAIPALLDKDFAAFTFLAIAIENFRETRRIEFESLQALEDVEYIFRGNAYIDGIAKIFEARNYLSLVVSLAASITMALVSSNVLWIEVLYGIVSGSVVFLLIRRFSKGKTVGDIADVYLGKIVVEKSNLYVDDMFVTNYLGLDNARELFKNEGMAAVIYPREDRLRLTLDNEGQRRAILFEVCRAFGLKRYHFTRKNFDDGRIVIVFVPIIRDEKKFIEIVKKTPLLESVKKSYKVMKTNLSGK